MKHHMMIFTVLIFMGYFFTGGGMAKNKPKLDDFAEIRSHMVDSQIKARGVNDCLVLNALSKVERHLYVPENLQQFAYADEPLPIGYGQTISQPYIVAYMTEALKLQPDHHVLEIGTGSGYQAAILAEIVSQVYTIEIVEPLALESQNNLFKNGYRNIHFKIGDGYQGWPEAAPFDAIIVTAAPPEIPQPLIDQLKEGGKMIIPIGVGYQKLILLTKKEGEIIQESLLPVRFVPMTGKIQKN